VNPAAAESPEFAPNLSLPLRSAVSVDRNQRFFHEEPAEALDRARLRRIENFDSDRGCFACGPDNPVGLRMSFYTDGTVVVSWLKIPAPLCGWRSVAHGGIVTTVLDEVMSWTAHHLIRRLILTKSIRVDFKRPLYTEREIRAEGIVRQLNNDREGVLCARIVDDRGRICATAEGTFALLTPKVARRLGIIEESIVANFERFLQEPSDSVGGGNP
jgi:uncharacterized protein (TIGR00369 family)